MRNLFELVQLYLSHESDGSELAQITIYKTLLKCWSYTNFVASEAVNLADIETEIIDCIRQMRHDCQVNKCGV